MLSLGFSSVFTPITISPRPGVGPLYHSPTSNFIFNLYFLPGGLVNPRGYMSRFSAPQDAEPVGVERNNDAHLQQQRGLHRKRPRIESPQKLQQILNYNSSVDKVCLHSNITPLTHTEKKPKNIILGVSKICFCINIC